MAEKVTESPSPWERWPDEILTEHDAGAQYEDCPWSEWMEGETWVARKDEDFSDAHEFSAEVWRRAGIDGLGADVIVWNPEVVFFRFLYRPEGDEAPDND